MTRPTTPAMSTGGDDRSARIAAAADRLLGHVATTGLGSVDVPDAESVVTFLRDLAAADGPAVDRYDPAPDGQLDPLSLAAHSVIDSLVRAGFEVSADVDDLDRAFRGLADVLEVLGVDVDPDVDPAPGAWLRCIRRAAVLRRNGR